MVLPYTSPSWEMTGPVWMPTWAGGRSAGGACSTTSSPAATAVRGSRKWNIPPSPSHLTGRPPRSREISFTSRASLPATCAATSSPRSSVSWV